MDKKPLILVVIALCFLISPFFILLQASIAANAPMIGYDNIFLRLSGYDILILFLYAICATAIFTVRRWGWYFFIIASLCLVIGNIAVLIIRPQYQILFALVYNLVLIITAAIFFRRNIITPYFHPRIRWWEQATRYFVHIEMRIKTTTGIIRAEILDLSSSGAFIETSEDLSSSENLSITVHSFGNTIDLQANVVRTANRGEYTGYGMAFCTITQQSQKALALLLSALEKTKMLNQQQKNHILQKNNRRIAKRSLLYSRSTINIEGYSSSAKLLDLSRSGCLLQIDSQIRKSDHDFFDVSFSCLGVNTTVKCRSVWFGERNGECVCGADFVYNNSEQKRAIKSIIKVCMKIPTAQKIPVPLSIDALTILALQTPYKHVHNLKGLFVQN